MSGVRRFEDIFDEIEEMFEDINREFEREFESLIRGINTTPAKGEKLGPIVYGWSVVIGPEGEPIVDVNETDNEVLVIAEMPGVDKSEIKLNATEDTLEIKAEKKYYKLVELPVKVNQKERFPGVPPQKKGAPNPEGLTHHLEETPLLFFPVFKPFKIINNST